MVDRRRTQEEEGLAVAAAAAEEGSREPGSCAGSISTSRARTVWSFSRRGRRRIFSSVRWMRASSFAAVESPASRGRLRELGRLCGWPSVSLQSGSGEKGERGEGKGSGSSAGWPAKKEARWYASVEGRLLAVLASGRPRARPAGAMPIVPAAHNCSS